MSDESRDPGRVLVVDDEPMRRQMVVNYLNENNMRAVSAAGRLEMERQSEPNPVILDLRLSQDDGLDLLREIRSHSDVPVIIVTGQRSYEIDRIVGLELGADYYIVMPFRENCLHASALYCGDRKWGELYALAIRSATDTDSMARGLIVAVEDS